MTWFPRLVKEQLAVNLRGDPLADGAGYPLQRGASNYYATFYGIAWGRYALAIYQGPTYNHQNDRRVS